MQQSDAQLAHTQSELKGTETWVFLPSGRSMAERVVAEVQEPSREAEFGFVWPSAFSRLLGNTLYREAAFG